LTTKEAWDTIKTIRVGADRVRVSKAQMLRNRYEALSFKPGESVDDFAMRLQEIVHQMEVLGDPVDDKKVIREYLKSVPKMYKQMARSIKSLLDIDTMSIEELTGRLKVCEDDEEGDAAGDAGSGKLLLTEEQWRSRMKQRDGDGSSGSGGSSNKNHRNKNRGRDGARNKGQAGNGAGSGASRDDECRYCGKLGHWARACRKKKREEPTSYVRATTRTIRRPRW
jgi:hypothetical protein